MTALATSLVITTFGLLWASAGPAAAHPLGNATVNHYDELVLSSSELVDQPVVDTAELPTFQRRARIDRDHDGVLAEAERASYAAGQCAAMAAAVRIDLHDRAARPVVSRSSYTERLGQAALTTGRLECTLRASIDISRSASLRFANTWDSAGIGWHEIVATGNGVTLRNSPFPARSISRQLRAYPGDLLSSPLDVREGTVTVLPGAGSSTYQRAEHLPVAGSAVRTLNKLATSFNSTVGQEHLTITVGLLGVLLAVLLGAGHALLPGHGKTVMAAYLVGRQGRLRDVVTVGATVTITHTAGVLVLGLLLTSGAAFAPTQAERYLGIISGLLIVAVGVGLLLSAVRRRRHAPLSSSLQPVPDLDPYPALVGVGAHALQRSPSEHLGGPQATHPGGHAHPHAHDPHEHRHGLLSRTHTHSHAPRAAGEPRAFSRSGLVGLGLAGGLVPSPSALLVLVAATALGRTAFGVVLVLAYGLGMAFTLCLAGLLLVRLRGRLGRLAGSSRLARADRLLAALPLLTALLVIGVGTGLALRAAGGSV
jgi:ABC-type nickel/cobalt efflux system permease component RcnA